MRLTDWNQSCSQHAGHVAALAAKLRDSRVFPVRSLGQGADGKQPVGGDACAAHHCALGAYIQSDPQWVGARNPVDHQCLQQPVGTLRDVGAGTGAVDYACRTQGFQAAALAAAEHDGCLAAIDVASNDPACAHPQLIRALGSFDSVRNLRRHAVTVHIPPGAHVTQKSLTIAGTQPAPDILCDRTQRIYHRLPGGPGLRRRSNLAPDPTREGGKVLWE
jgi:hypothetical protein